MIFPRLVPRSKKARLYPLYRWVMMETGRRAARIVTDSNASRDDIIRLLRIADPSKVRTVYSGVSSRFKPAPGRTASADPGRPRTLLYVGRADPYKNLVTIIRALPQIRKQCPFPVSLTVAGSPDPRYPEARAAAEEWGVADAVKWTGYLSDDALASLYQTSDVLVHLSLCEGFGLQVAEAMASGLPVVCSNTSSLPEVAGDAAILVDPTDVAQVAARVAEVLTRPDLAGELARKGAARAAQFTWPRAAAETLAIYRELR